MKGATTDPSVSTKRLPSNTRKIMIGANHHFLRTLRKSQSSKYIENPDIVIWIQRFNKKMVGRTGIEPVARWLRVSCSTSWANDPHQEEFSNISTEGTLPPLALPHKEADREWPTSDDGAPGRIWTCDTWLRRPVLYPLSYRRGKSYRTNSQHMHQYWRFSLITTHKTVV